MPFPPLDQSPYEFVYNLIFLKLHRIFFKLLLKNRKYEMANSKFLDKHRTIFTDTFKMEYGNTRVTKKTKPKNTPSPTTQRILRSR